MRRLAIAPCRRRRAPRFERRPHHPQASELLARVCRCLLELFHDLIQVVARCILKGRKLLVGFQLLQPQRLADGQQIPVVYISRDRPGERAAEPEIRLFPLAHPHLEWIALEVYHAGCELGLDSRGDEAGRAFGRDREIHLPILIAHRRRVLAGIVEEGVARGIADVPAQCTYVSPHRVPGLVAQSAWPPAGSRASRQRTPPVGRARTSWSCSWPVSSVLAARTGPAAVAHSFA